MISQVYNEDTFCEERDIIGSIFEFVAKTVVQLACSSAHGFQVVQVNFREFRVIEKLMDHGGIHGYLCDRMSDATPSGKEIRQLKVRTGEGS